MENNNNNNDDFTITFPDESPLSSSSYAIPYSSRANRVKASTTIDLNELPKMTLEEAAFVSNLALFIGGLYVDDVQVREVQVPFSPLGISILNRVSINKRPCLIKVSVMGAKETNLDNLSVLANGIKKISGSGTRLATEWWEKKDGYELTTIEIGGTYLAIYFQNEKWHMAECNQMLYEGAELCNDILFVREELTFPFCIYKWPSLHVMPVMKHDFSHPIPLGIEGIIIVIDNQLYRLKEHHTIDLLYKEGTLVNREGHVIFRTNLNHEGIVEYTFEGEFVKARPDKSLPDSAAKIVYIRHTPVLAELRKYLQHINVEKGEYIPTQWIGYEFFLNQNGWEPAISENSYHQLLSPDQVPVLQSYRVQHKQHSKPYTSYVTETVTLEKFINAKYRRLDFPKFINTLRRVGYSYNLWELRKFLIDSGVILRGDHYEAPPYVVFKPFPMDHYIYVPHKLYSFLIVNQPYYETISHMSHPLTLPYYLSTLGQRLRDVIEAELESTDEYILDRYFSIVDICNSLYPHDVFLALQALVLDYIDREIRTPYAITTELMAEGYFVQDHVGAAVLTALKERGWVTCDDGQYSIIPDSIPCANRSQCSLSFSKSDEFSYAVIGRKYNRRVVRLISIGEVNSTP